MSTESAVFRNYAAAEGTVQFGQQQQPKQSPTAEVVVRYRPRIDEDADCGGGEASISAVATRRLTAIKDNLSTHLSDWMTQRRRDQKCQRLSALLDRFKLGFRRSCGPRADRAEECLSRVKVRLARAMTQLKEDVRRIGFWRSVLGEFIGTMFIVLIGCGSGIETDQSVDQSPTLRMALAFGLTYAASLYCLRGEGHLNTAVTLAMAVTRRMSIVRGVLYFVFQLAGAVVGSIALVWISDEDMSRNSTGHRLTIGCTLLADDVSEGQGFLVEFLATLVLVFVVFACYDGEAGRRTSVAPFVAGIALVAVSLFSIPYTGGSVNSARSFGPAMVLNVWSNHWIYWFGPAVGGICGGILYELLFSASSSCKRLHKSLFQYITGNRTSGPPSRESKDEELLEMGKKGLEKRNKERGIKTTTMKINYELTSGDDSESEGCLERVGLTRDKFNHPSGNLEVDERSKTTALKFKRSESYQKSVNEKTSPVIDTAGHSDGLEDAGRDEDTTKDSGGGVVAATTDEEPTGDTTSAFGDDDLPVPTPINGFVVLEGGNEEQTKNVKKKLVDGGYHEGEEEDDDDDDDDFSPTVVTDDTSDSLEDI